MGNWFLRGDELVLDLSDAVTVGGEAVNVRLTEIALDLHATGIVSRLIST